ncbi:hypothetical protein LOAG_03948 [Loa loa]|uniref:Uncharacterized protein n=1 Tax=Loa loa TaxID=7209 RepID=A0A1S0U400_LOALO|nr:hypothetical protein LOAG_03948 [Loa loa]EFO24536.1 hypothetical protein LOAG_03948 [Loa loa]
MLHSKCMQSVVDNWKQFDKELIQTLANFELSVNKGRRIDERRMRKGSDSCVVRNIFGYDINYLHKVLIFSSMTIIGLDLRDLRKFAKGNEKWKKFVVSMVNQKYRKNGFQSKNPLYHKILADRIVDIILITVDFKIQFHVLHGNTLSYESKDHFGQYCGRDEREIIRNYSIIYSLASPISYR